MSTQELPCPHCAVSDPALLRASGIKVDVLTVGYGPPTETCLIVPPIHCAVHCVSVDRPIAPSAVLTCSAVVMQRGSSMPMSHWWSAATVQVASRCSFGRQVSSKSPIAPPASSNSHAARRRGSAPRHRRQVEKVLTASDGRVCELHHGAVDHFVGQGRDEGRAEEPLPPGCASKRCQSNVKAQDT